jgi:hypothetical protein
VRTAKQILVQFQFVWALSFRALSGRALLRRHAVRIEERGLYDFGRNGTDGMAPGPGLHRAHSVPMRAANVNGHGQVVVLMLVLVRG